MSDGEVEIVEIRSQIDGIDRPLSSGYMLDKSSVEGTQASSGDVFHAVGYRTG
jgi:hypothetical protein